ncbi:OmpH family outer membrane protein [Flammeovirga sp. MY04]|uniref:OmpH family outer membrane protein n=1 Tax=Flammeovirga sp. MY04 TaxID=1191459 RepID=UPI0008063581|nr:OmpH family outer membrane protein [Flammeovirga sp. MY04]ANQ47562.1 OmpH family outer membrane protein [Flammeovirga sp. MY04]
MKKILFALWSLMMLSSVANAQQKVAFINEDSVITSMPEFKTQQKIIESYAKQFQTQIEMKQRTMQEKYQTLMQGQQTMSPQQLDEGQKELQEMQVEVQELQQRAQQGIQKKQQDAMEPLMKKLKEQVKAVAEAEGYSVVIANGVVNRIGFLINAGGEDITGKVIAKINGQ